ncbi:hypothetical protein BJY04DRAFT_217214 [Aspergillus karnatakaensis]|uniref:RNA recognition motif domain-containing protein n=1 Tax=Aspergillus karnatakaensis TaxID=1810916 RepID=UPI003CCD196E
MPASVYIGHLSSNTTSAELESAFDQYGIHPSNVSIMQDRDTGDSRGFAFATFDNASDAQNAINALSHTQLNGSEITMNMANQRPSGGGGGYGHMSGSSGAEYGKQSLGGYGNYSGGGYSQY